jgi:hypothetical protein
VTVQAKHTHTAVLSVEKFLKKKLLGPLEIFLVGEVFKIN